MWLALVLCGFWSMLLYAGNVDMTWTHQMVNIRNYFFWRSSAGGGVCCPTRMDAKGVQLL